VCPPCFIKTCRGELVEVHVGGLAHHRRQTLALTWQLNESKALLSLSYPVHTCLSPASLKPVTINCLTKAEPFSPRSYYAFIPSVHMCLSPAALKPVAINCLTKAEPFPPRPFHTFIPPVHMCLSSASLKPVTNCLTKAETFPPRPFHTFIPPVHMCLSPASLKPVALGCSMYSGDLLTRFICLFTL